MDFSKGKEIFFNRAETDESSCTQVDRTDFECCGELLAFAMKDRHHAFTIGLSTILHCLAIAEQEGYVPKLPGEWWLMVRD